MTYKGTKPGGLRRFPPKIFCFNIWTLPRQNLLTVPSPLYWALQKTSQNYQSNPKPKCSGWDTKNADRLGHRDTKNENNLGHRDTENADKMLGHRYTKNADRLGHRDIKNVDRQTLNRQTGERKKERKKKKKSRIQKSPRLWRLNIM